jgi:hypothetical protein
LQESSVHAKGSLLKEFEKDAENEANCSSAENNLPTTNGIVFKFVWGLFTQ